MKKFLLAFFLAAFPLVAQEAELQKDAVRAFQENDMKTARSLFQSLLALNPKNTAAQNYLRAIAQKEKSGGGSIETSLTRVILPKVEFRDTTVREAVTFVVQKVSALTDGKQTVNVVWMIPSDYESPITLSLQNVPASTALKYIADSANLRLDYGAHALSIRLQAGATSAPATLPKGKTAVSPMEANLSKVILPKVDFNEASVREAVDFIAQRIKSLTDGKQMLNVVWLLPPDFDSRVTLNLENIPASEALRYVASTANLRMDFGEHALTIKPAQ